MSVFGRVYLLTCRVSGKLYVGQTKGSLDKRWRSHKHSAGSLKRTQPISHAIRKYGPGAFDMVELESSIDQISLDAAECRWARELGTFAPSGYNLRAGNGPNSVSESVRQKLRENMTPARRAALSLRWKGVQLSPQAREASVAAHARSCTLLDPSGNPVTFYNVARFARANGLTSSNLSYVANGQRPQHKGWRLIPAGGSVAAVEVDGHLLCPSCGRTFDRQMRRAAGTHATSCSQLRQRLSTALLLNHITLHEHNVRLQELATPVAHTSANGWCLTAVFRSPDGIEVEVVNVAKFADRKRTRKAGAEQVDERSDCVASRLDASWAGARAFGMRALGSDHADWTRHIVGFHRRRKK